MMSLRFSAAWAAASLFLPLVATAQEEKPVPAKPAATKPEEGEPQKAAAAAERPPAPQFKMWHPRTPKDDAAHAVDPPSPRPPPRRRSGKTFAG